MESSPSFPRESQSFPRMKWRRTRDTARRSEFDWLCAAIHIHIVEAIRSGKYKVVFCFTRTIKQARAFQRRLQRIREMLAEKYPDENLGGDYPIEHMHGGMNMTKRKEILSRVEQAELGIVCAAKVLNEGIDIPCCDTVVFLEAKGSVVDIAQCSGRCNRLYPGKKFANIVIPALLSEDEILNPGEDDRAGFRVLRETLSLLCVLDKELRAVLCGAADANPDSIDRREKFEIARIGRADRVRVDLQALVDRLKIAEVLLESMRNVPFMGALFEIEKYVEDRRVEAKREQEQEKSAFPKPVYFSQETKIKLTTWGQRNWQCGRWYHNIKMRPDCGEARVCLSDPDVRKRFDSLPYGPPHGRGLHEKVDEKLCLLERHISEGQPLNWNTKFKVPWDDKPFFGYRWLGYFTSNGRTAEKRREGLDEKSQKRMLKIQLNFRESFLPVQKSGRPESPKDVIPYT